MSDTNDKRRVPAGELSHICAWSDEKLVKLREYKLALDLRDSRAECEWWRELHNIKEACREHAEQELAALREGIKQECGDEDDYVCVEVGVFRALLKDDEGGAYRRGRDIPTAEAKAVAGGDSQEPPPPVTAAPSSDYCTDCGGTGRRPVFHHCPTCNGTGKANESEE